MWQGPKLSIDCLGNEVLIGMGSAYRHDNSPIDVAASFGANPHMSERKAIPAKKVATRGYVMRGGSMIREGAGDNSDSAAAEDYR